MQNMRGSVLVGACCMYAVALLAPVVGWLVVAIVSTLVYSAWRNTERHWDAVAINRHAWVALMVGVACWGVAFLVVR